MVFWFFGFLFLVLPACLIVLAMHHRRTWMPGIVLMVIPMALLIFMFMSYWAMGPFVFPPVLVLRHFDRMLRDAPALSEKGGPASSAERNRAMPPPNGVQAEAEEEPVVSTPRAQAPAGGPTAGTAKPSAMGAGASPPEWVGSSPRRTPAGYQMSVATDPFATPLECQRQLPEVLRRAVAQYIAVYLGDEALAARIELPPEFVGSQIVKAQWEEPFESSVGPMVRLHALLVFDHKVNARIDEACHQHRIQDRVWRLGVILAGILAVLAAAWGYLKLDLATDGRYRWRLRLAAGLAILGVAAAGWAMWA